MKKYHYNTKEFNFAEILKYHFNTDNLESLSSKNSKFSKPEDYLLSPYHLVYSSLLEKDYSFLNLYKKFVKKNVKNIFKFDILAEKIPTLRVHYPNCLSVKDFHKDREYPLKYFLGNLHESFEKSDVKNLYKNEINFWIPLTRCYETNSLWVESEENLGDYVPFKSCYGEFIQFDGANLYHGTKINRTKITRVSLDFRIISKKLFDEFVDKKSDKFPEVVESLKSKYFYLPNNIAY